MEFIDLGKQYTLYREEIDAAIRKVLERGSYIMGPEVAELEKILADYVGVSHCITVSSGTDSLQMSLMALEVGPGDEVITVPFTWISTAEVIKLVGADPVFVDIDADTYLMDVNLAEKAITSKTKAIIPVDLFGQCADYSALNALSEKYGIPIIQDAAQSFGAMQNGRKSCSQGLLSSTSFFPAKPFGCYGDGGAVFTDDDVLAGKIRAIRTHGGEKRHHHTLLGMNGRFDTIQAAVLLAKFPHFSKEVRLREKIGNRYNELFSDLGISPKTAEGNSHVYAIYTIRIKERDRVAENLKAEGIPSAVYYPKCLHEQPVFASLGYSYGDFPHCEQASREVLSLPMHPWLTEEEQDLVVKVVSREFSVACV